MANVFGGFQGFQNIGNIAFMIGVGFVVLIFCVGIAILIAWMVGTKKQKMIYEVDLSTKKMKMYAAREKMDASGKKRLWIKSHDCYLPLIQTKHIFSFKGKDIIFLLKDYNNLFYTLGIPDYNDLKGWINIKYGIDIEKESKFIHDSLKKENKEDNLVDFNKSFIDKLKERFFSHPKIHEALDLLTSIFFLPNPAEDLNWLANEVAQSKKRFNAHWYDNPNLLMIAYFGMMLIGTVMWIIVMKKM